MRNNGQFIFTGTTFDKWYSDFNDKLTALTLLENEKLDAILKLDQIFLKYNQIFGLAKNQYAQDLRRTFLKIQEFFDIPTQGGLAEVLGIARNKIGEFYGSTHPDDRPKGINPVIEKLIINPLSFILKEKFGSPENSISNDFTKDSVIANIFIQGQDTGPALIIKYDKGLNVEISDQFTQDQRVYIEDFILLVEKTINTVLGYHASQAFLEGYRDSERKEFYSRVFEILNKYIDGFYSIQFGKLNDLLSHNIKSDLVSSNRDIPFEIYTLENIKYNILKITAQQINDIIERDITKAPLLAMKAELIKCIDNYMLTFRIVQGGNIATYKYFSGHNFNDRKLMISLSSNLLMATHLKTGRKPSFNTFREKIFAGEGTNMFERLRINGFPQSGTKQARGFSKSLEKIYKTVYNWFKEDLGTRDSSSKDSFFDKYKPLDQESKIKFLYYSKVLRSIAEISTIKGYDFASPSLQAMTLTEGLDAKDELIMNAYDLNKWNNDKSKLAHRVFHLSSYLGFDPLFFTNINKDMGKSRRHHFIAILFRKMSSYVRDSALTDTQYHGTYETLFDEMGPLKAEAFIQGLMDSIEELIYFKDTNGNYKKDIDPDDVKTILKKNLGTMWEKAYEYWTKGKEGSSNTKDTGQFRTDLGEFNRIRKTYIFDFANNKIKKDWQRFFLEKEFIIFYRDHLKVLERVPSLWKYFAYKEDIQYMKTVFTNIIRINLGTDGLDSFINP